MKRFTLKRELLLLVSGAMVFTACQKEVSTNPPPGETEDISLDSEKYTGVIYEDPEMMKGVIHLVSTEFNNFSKQSAPGSKGGGKRAVDSDGDGIPDSSDSCPTQKETVNGYQDTDGCPDTVPVTLPKDTDNDGIEDNLDSCPTQAETFNGYQDGDGCPDTVPDPIVIPPSTVPAAYQIKMPSVGYQGTEGSCVPWAVAYAARSAMQYYKTSVTSYSNTSNVFSPEFVYNQIKFSDCGSGTSVTRAIDFLKTSGVCTWQTMPYSYTNGCSLLPTSNQTTEAANFKISSVSLIDPADVSAIKSMISQNNPLVIAINIDNSFYSAKTGFIWSSYPSAPFVSHVVAICGYDDTKKAYKIMNSWGTGWGDAGYGWIDYSFLPKAGGWVYKMSL